MKRVTIEDVAEAAGVSRQTVSRAINDKGEISEQTKERVMSAVEKLGYRPNRLAQSMVTNRTMTIGLIVSDITNPFFPEVARGVQDAAREHDYNILLCNTDDDPEEEINNLYSLAEHLVDGIIMMSASAEKDDLAAFTEIYRPIIMINRDFHHPHVDLILVDNLHGGYLATEHLIALGHRVIGMIAPPGYEQDPIKRLKGYQAALAEHVLPGSSEWVVAASTSVKGGYDGLQQLLARTPEMTAVFAYNDLMALGALRAAREMGRRVPEDIAIVGFDDISLASMVTPSLSSIRVDKYELGRLALNRLLERLADLDGDLPTIEIPVELQVRESTIGDENA